jgi:hypothetical protein
MLDSIQFNPVTVAAGTQTAQVSFASYFTVLPKVSVVYTGYEHQSLTASVNYGWFAGVSSITTSGAVV